MGMGRGDGMGGKEKEGREREELRERVGREGERKGREGEGKKEGMWRGPETGLPRGRARWLSAGLLLIVSKTDLMPIGNTEIFYFISCKLHTGTRD